MRVPHPVLEEVLEVAAVARHVRARAAHVEGDHPRKTGASSGERGPHHASRGTGKQAVLGMEGARPHQTARAGHHMKRAPGQRAPHPFQVAFQDRREIGVHDGGLGARQDFDQGRQPGRERDVAEAGCAKHLPQLLLVPGIAVGVQERHRRRLETGGEQTLGFAAELTCLQRHEHGAVRGQPLGHLHRLGEERHGASRCSGRRGRGAAGCR